MKHALTIGAAALGLFASLTLALPAAPLAAQFMTNTPSASDLGRLTTPAVTPSPRSGEGGGGVLPSATPLALSTATAPLVVTPTAAASTPKAAGTPQPVIYNAPECRYVQGQPTSAACTALMEKYPEPDVTEIQPDGFTLSQYSFWKLTPGTEVTKFDAPGGSPIGTIPVGFNFINATNTTVEGWLEVQGGGWIQREFAAQREASYFTGVTLPEGWAQPFGIVLDTTGIYASLVPGGESTKDSGLVPLHYERYNIFAEEVAADGWKWYLVGPNQWVKQVYMAVIQPTEKPEGVSGRWAAVDLFEQTLVAYEDDVPVFATLISTGLPGTETNEGLFDVWAAVPTDTMSGATGAPNAYALQSVPWVMYFDGSISLHGTYWHDTFGYRRSRGCVNLSISDARWMFNFLQDSPQTNDKGEPLMMVYVHSTGEYREGDNK